MVIRITTAIIAICTILCSCTGQLHEKNGPEYQGVDRRAQPYIDEYLTLASKDQIVFSHLVTVGFTDIEESGVAAYCTYGKGWREIDIDTAYWKSANELERKEVLWHELTHCYCNRQHDFSENGKLIRYPETREIREFMYKEAPTKHPGYYEDWCPKSMMHPIAINSMCVEKYFDQYTTELFNNCEPW